MVRARQDQPRRGEQRHWSTALQGQALSKCLARFRLPWQWDGKPATLASRATDATGEVQPSHDALLWQRDALSNYYYNAVQRWAVSAEGAVTNAGQHHGRAGTPPPPTGPSRKSWGKAASPVTPTARRCCHKCPDLGANLLAGSGQATPTGKTVGIQRGYAGLASPRMEPTQSSRCS
jgi:hypothetical protein